MTPPPPKSPISSPPTPRRDRPSAIRAVLPFVACLLGRASGKDPSDSVRALRVRFDLDLVALTRGPAGALLVSRTEVINQPGIPTVVRDTVGAGDSFTAALVVGRLRGDPVPTIARVACETAASVCTYAGALPDAPAPGAR